MFNNFSHRHTPCTINGEAEKVILSRETKATTVMGKEYVYNGLFAPSSVVELGDLVQTDVSFMVLTMRQTVERDKYCSLLKTNTTVDIQRYGREFDANYNPIGKPKFLTVQAEVVCFAQYVTGALRQDEPGLLETTKYVLVLQTSANIERPQDNTPDRILLDGRPYQVDVVDGMKYPNLLHIQLSEDTR
ncbi:hypothetical protein [Paenibacillus sinopodophylli]|uniref:hypothetical protein n=1 Tax=Paenibacillus sinopodophylli TaxID=1837342 RepID=UPI00110CFDC1|nr:hypothetical protein [Paenibacillus sinopodophylli]